MKLITTFPDGSKLEYDEKEDVRYFYAKCPGCKETFQIIDWFSYLHISIHGCGFPPYPSADNVKKTLIRTRTE